MDAKMQITWFNKSDPHNCGRSTVSDNYGTRPTKFHEVKLRTHHGGLFVTDATVTYVGGFLAEEKDGWDVDEMSSIELSKYIKSLGYNTYKCLWYKHPEFDLSNGLRPLNNDVEVLKFANDIKGYKTIDLYVEHLVNTHEKPECENNVSDDNVKVIEVEGERQKESKSECEVEKDTCTEVKGQKRSWIEENGQEQFESNREGDEDYEGEGEYDGEEESESDDEDYIAKTDDEQESDSNISLDDSDYDEYWDWTSVLAPETVDPKGSHRFALTATTGVNVEVIGGAPAVRPISVSRNPKPTTFADFVDEDGDSGDIDSPPLSDEEDQVTKKFPKFKMPEDNGRVQFEIGLTFNSKELVKDAMKEYAMLQKKNLYLAKNDATRMVIRCMKGCPFYVRVSKSSSSHYFQVVTCNGTHTCHRTAKNRQAKTGWLAKKFVNILRHTPYMKTKGLIAEAKEKWGVILTRYQAYRAKKKALEMIQGAGSEQYKHLRNYAEELRRSNPNSTVIIKCGTGNKGPVFERIYICFQACKAAFVTTCRPLIGLDGCFLKGVYGGQLLAAVGKDGNNQMLPIAFAIVEAETKDSWAWLVKLLLEDLGEIEQRRWSFISDQQKGLVPTLQELNEHVEHRLCMKHLYGNWRKKYPGIEMKEALWKAARANTLPEWQRAMENIKKMDEQAWNDMIKIPPPMWTRSAYSTHTQCDLQVNNMCEAFNSAILEYRDKPIINLIEGLKFYISNRVVTQRDLMLRYRGNICPVIQQLLEKNKKDADGWSPNWSGDEAYALFEVSKDIDKYVVNLTKRSCSCRKWDLSGIPCCHAVACMWSNNHIPEDYVANCYSKETFLRTYSHIILPCNGPKLWPIINTDPIQPPYMRRAPGRPKKLRKKTNDEPRNPHKLARQNTTVRCKRCGSLGHNIRTCKVKTAADRVIPRGGNKKQKQGGKKKQQTQNASASLVNTQVTGSGPQPSQNSVETQFQASVQTQEIGARASSEGRGSKGNQVCGTQEQ